jgi:hypothetical protein
MSLYVFFGIVAGIWLMSVVPSVLAICWSRRFRRSVILSLLALAIAWCGMKRFHFDSTTTVNGQVKWRFDSQWLFMASLVLGAFALGCSIWRKMNSAHVA